MWLVCLKATEVGVVLFWSASLEEPENRFGKLPIGGVLLCDGDPIGVVLLWEEPPVVGVLLWEEITNGGVLLWEEIPIGGVPLWEELPIGGVSLWEELPIGGVCLWEELGGEFTKVNGKGGVALWEETIGGVFLEEQVLSVWTNDKAIPFWPTFYSEQSTSFDGLSKC